MHDDSPETSRLIRIHGTETGSTDLAICFEMDGDALEEMWFPRSQLHQDSEGAWFCREWLAKKKGLI